VLIRMDGSPFIELNLPSPCLCADGPAARTGALLGDPEAREVYGLSSGPCRAAAEFVPAAGQPRTPAIAYGRALGTCLGGARSALPGTRAGGIGKRNAESREIMKYRACLPRTEISSRSPNAMRAIGVRAFRTAACSSPPRPLQPTSTAATVLVRNGLSCRSPMEPFRLDQGTARRVSIWIEPET